MRPGIQPGDSAWGTLQCGSWEAIADEEELNEMVVGEARGGNWMLYLSQLMMPNTVL
jgi:hypothetical protein